MPPYRKRYAKRSYGRARSMSRRRRPMGGSFMKRARTRAFANLRTGGLIAIERKFHDVAMSYKNVPQVTNGVGTGVASTFSPSRAEPDTYRSATGTITTVAPIALNVLIAADSGSDRDGRQVINDSIHLRGKVDFLDGSDWSTTNAATVVNIVCVLDTQNNGSSPAGSAIFVNPGDFTGSGRDNGSGAFVNLSNSKRFRILKHTRRLLAPSGVSGNGTVTRVSGSVVWSMDIPLKGMKTNYVTDSSPIASATAASIGDNGLYLFVWTEHPDGFISHCYNSRLRFRG